MAQKKSGEAENNRTKYKVSPSTKKSNAHRKSKPIKCPFNKIHNTEKNIINETTYHFKMITKR
jgi:hypothetical protein